jgi:hypothetical protein
MPITCGRHVGRQPHQLFRQQGRARPGRSGQGRSTAARPAGPRFKGKVYRLAELVVDVPSLIQRLAELAGDSLLAGKHRTAA